MNPASAALRADAPRAGGQPHPTGPGHVPAAAWPIAILGVPFDALTIDETVARIDAMIAKRRPHFVVTANVDLLVQAHRDAELRRSLVDADLVLCDGTPLLWASRWLGNALPERVAGSDLVPALIHSAAEKGQRLFFLGSSPGVAAAAEAKLKQQYPSLEVVGTYAPPFPHLLETDHDEIVRRVREARPDILLVSFGCPKQENWIALHHRSLGVPVAIGVGATLDSLAGRIKRAPQWMRRSGMEWLYRLWHEPGQLYWRYASDLLHFVSILAAQWWRFASSAETPARPRENAPAAPGWCSVDAGSRLTRHSLQHEAEFWHNLRHRRSHCVMDLSRVRRVDSTGVAFLIRCRKELQSAGWQLVLLAPSTPLRRVLAILQLSDYFVIASDLTEATRCGESLVTSVTCRDGTTRSLAWCGELVAANCEDVWQMTTDHIRAFVGAHATLIIVDLNRLRFTDSSGAALMLRLKKWTRSLRAELLFAHAQPNVRNVLRLTQLDQFLLEGSQ